MAEYISRQAAIEALRDYFDEQIAWSDDADSFVAGCCEETINDIPAADVRENKHGHWIAKDERGIQCSECGYMTGELFAIYEPLDESIAIADGVVITQKGNPRFAFKYPYFCASCGADMRG